MHLNNNTSYRPLVENISTKNLSLYLNSSLIIFTLREESFKALSLKWDQTGQKHALYSELATAQANFSPKMQRFDQSLRLIESVTTNCPSLLHSPSRSSRAEHAAWDWDPPGKQTVVWRWHVKPNPLWNYRETLCLNLHSSTLWPLYSISNMGNTNKIWCDLIFAFT